ncbi:conserved membrane hypothetical protein [Gammaproteobacteria bacterium]
MLAAWHVMQHRWPVSAVLLVQIIVLLTTSWLVLAAGVSLPAIVVVTFQGVLAAVITARLSLARWWILFQLLFPFAFTLGLAVRLPPLAWLGAFVVVWIIERNTVRERVPLYLSGGAACRALNTLLPGGQFRFIDLGCGPGGLLARLAVLHPQGHFEGVESAPLPWLIARLLLGWRGNCRVRWGNFWDLTLGEYDVVYCFLSPAPMEQLWIKAQDELRPGALLVSNTFIAPNAPPPSQVLPLSDFSGPLYVWRI